MTNGQQTEVLAATLTSASVDYGAVSAKLQTLLPGPTSSASVRYLDIYLIRDPNRTLLRDVGPPAKNALTVAFTSDGPLDELREVLRDIFPDGTMFHQGTISPPDPDARPVTAIEYYGQGEYRRDWITPLAAPAAGPDTHRRKPPAFNTIVPKLISKDHAIIVQCRIGPGPQKSDVEHVSDVIESNNYTIRDALFRADENTINRESVIADITPENLYTVNCRAVGYGLPQSDNLESLKEVFSSISGAHYEVTGNIRTGDDAKRVAADVANNILYDSVPVTKYSIWNRTHRAIIARADVLPHFCYLDADALVSSHQTALGVRAPEDGSPTGLSGADRERLYNRDDKND